METLNIAEVSAQLKPYANKDCRDCDGSGIFYGNVCICGCILTKLEKANEV